MSKSKSKIKAEKYLAANAVDQVHATSDGFQFLKKPDAIAHAKTLKDPKVETFGKSAKKIEASDAVDESGLQKGAKEITDKKAADKKAADKKVADKKVADKKVADKKVTDKKAADKKAADKKVADKKVADKKVTDETDASQEASDNK